MFLKLELCWLLMVSPFLNTYILVLEWQFVSPCDSQCPQNICSDANPAWQWQNIFENLCAIPDNVSATIITRIPQYVNTFAASPSVPADKAYFEP